MPPTTDEPGTFRPLPNAGRTLSIAREINCSRGVQTLALVYVKP